MDVSRLIDDAIRVVILSKIDQLTVRVARLRAEERSMIADMKGKGGVMPNNYWQPRHHAEGQLRAAQAALEAFR